MQTLASIALDAIAYGSILFIISIGLSITLGLMRIVNLAHGAFAMIGGYLAAYFIATLGLNYFIAIFLAIIATVILAIPTEYFLYRRLYKANQLTQILMTIGLTFFIIGIVNYIAGPVIKEITLPEILQGSVDLGFRHIAKHRLFIIFVGLFIAFSLWLILERSQFGIKIRATVDNADMAQLLGVHTNIIYAASFALAVGLAVLGGILGAELLPLEPYYAMRVMVIFLVIVCIGGANSIFGTLSACLLLGAIDTTGRYFAPEYGNFFFYVAVIIIVSFFQNGFLKRLKR